MYSKVARGVVMRPQRLVNSLGLHKFAPAHYSTISGTGLMGAAHSLRIDLVTVSKWLRPVMVSQHFYLVCK